MDNITNQSRGDLQSGNFINSKQSQLMTIQALVDHDKVNIPKKEATTKAN